MVTVIANEPEPEEIKMDGVVDEERGIHYWGIATRQENGKYRCLANVGGCLCLVELIATPAEGGLKVSPE